MLLTILQTYLNEIRKIMSLKKSILFAVIATSVCLSAYASDNSGNTGRSPEFKQRIDREKAAEDERDKNEKIQEQQRLEQAELVKLRKERTEQRAARRNAAAQQPQ